jgi:mannose-6-phosphate isomerase-like protein (cupin superfamily)
VVAWLACTMLQGWRLRPKAARTYRVPGDNDLRPHHNPVSRCCDAEAAATDAERWHLLVSQLARRVAGGIDKTPPRTVVILTETAGVPSWEDAYDALAGALGLPVRAGRPPADVVRQYLAGGGHRSVESFWQAYSAMLPDEPPLGYRHLANLVVKGGIDLVLTTSWDPLLEVAFSKIFQPAQYRVLIRGELGDAELANALLQRGIPQIVKLNGDLRSDLITRVGRERAPIGATPEIVTALRDAFTGATVIIDSPARRSLDTDVTRLMTLATADADLIYEVRQPGGGPCSNWLSRHTRITNHPVADIDTFMIELDREVELAARHRTGWDGQALQEEMLRSLEISVASVPHDDATRSIEELAGLLKSAGIEWIAYVEDPAVPGGTELRRLLDSTPIGTTPHLHVSMTGENGNRLVNRRAVVQPDASVPAGSRVAVVDSAAFSGRTLQLAIEALTSRFTRLDVVPAVLVASQYLAQGSRNGERWIDRLVYTRITRRHHVAFPWGTYFLTDTITQEFGYGMHPRPIESFQRPWGTGEVFTTSETCSVRVLTIHAAQKISFHRHFCRDELFVALDDDVGVDISGDEFKRGSTGEFDGHVKSVTLKAGDYLLIPRGMWHRFHAPRGRIRALEVAFGIYDEEFDIERLLDLYGRADRLD